jgi:protein-S-isoprenylcysteine O-methyltransferase Ste14
VYRIWEEVTMGTLDVGMAADILTSQEAQDIDLPRKSRWARARGILALASILPVGLVVSMNDAPLPAGGSRQACWTIAGWVCFCLGGMLRWWATLYIGDRKGQRLVVEGPYSLCRNPLYLGTFLIVLSIAVTLASISFMLWLMVVSAIYLHVTVSDEERRLRHRFGEAYLRYCRDVPVLCQLLLALRAQDWWPHVIHLP